MEALFKHILFNPLSCLTTNRISKIIQDIEQTFGFIRVWERSISWVYITFMNIQCIVIVMITKWQMIKLLLCLLINGMNTVIQDKEQMGGGGGVTCENRGISWVTNYPLHYNLRMYIVLPLLWLQLTLNNCGIVRHHNHYCLSFLKIPNVI